MTLDVILLCDATAAIGLGHLSRTLALGEALVDEGSNCVVAGQLEPAAIHIVDDAGMKSIPFASRVSDNWDAVCALAKSKQLVVVDDYELTSDNLARLSGLATTVCIDDFASLDRYRCDFVINVTAGAQDLHYETDGVALLGTSHVLARRNLRQARTASAARNREPVRNILVSLGSIDRTGVTPTLLNVITTLAPDANLRVVTSALDPNRDELHSIGAKARQVEVIVQAREMAEHFLWSDVAITGGGVTKGEAAYLTVPVAVLPQTDAEAVEAERFAAAGVGIALPPSMEDLRDALERFLGDPELRVRLRSSASQAYGSDPTGDTARRILSANHGTPEGAGDHHDTVRSHVSLRMESPRYQQHLAELTAHYREALEVHGDGPQAVQWSDQETQERRMSVLAEVGDLRIARVLDFGCGTGHLLTFLTRSGFQGEYTGLDIVPEMVERAASKHPDARFISTNVLDENLPDDFDYVLINGTFNNSATDSFGLTTALLSRLWPHARIGLAFNCMSIYVDRQEDHLAYFDPAEVFAWCKENLSPLVTLRHDYLVRADTIPFEFAVYVYRSTFAPIPALRR